MALINFGGFETGDSAEAAATAGTFSVQSTIKRTGNYALRVNPASTATGYHRYGSITAAGRPSTTTSVGSTVKCTFWIYAASHPSNYELLWTPVNTSGNAMMAVAIGSTGLLRVYNRSLAIVATGTNAVPLTTHTRIDVLTTKGTTGAFEVRINGVAELSGTCDQNTIDIGSWIFGRYVNLNSSSNYDIYFDDWAVDTADYAGEVAVVNLVPDGNGNYTTWTGDYTAVDEVPHDSGTTTISVVGTGSAQNESPSLISAATAGITGTVLGVRPWIIAAGDNVNTEHLATLRSGSTDGTFTLPNVLSPTYVMLTKLFTTDPATSAAWSVAALDSIEPVVKAQGVAGTHLCTAMGAQVLYIPSAVTADTPWHLMTGRAA